MKEAHWDYDLLVVGGGVNGTGIAADASGRGLGVLLCEMNDLASATSSNSSKLVHGGLRYLEHYEFRLVKEALAEREVLLKNAPHIIWPLRFQLPHQRHLRPGWMIRAGLFLYDHLSKRVTLPASKGVSYKENSPLISTITKGFEYSDAWVDDARLVVLNAKAAENKGATIKTRTKCVGAKRVNGGWSITLENSLDQSQQTVTAKAIVNAAGPWVTQLFSDALKAPSPKNIRLVRGSHIVVPKIHDGDHAFILQNEDGRIVFVIPYESDFSLVGTTDIEHEAGLGSVSITDDETSYLIKIVNEYFNKKTQKEDIAHSYSGVRPLLDDGSDSAQTVTRDYTFEVEAPVGQGPLLSIFGGKITTYRKLSEAAVDQLQAFFPEMKASWTADAALPGGDFDSPKQLQADLEKQYPYLPEALVERYVRSYGTLSYTILQGVSGLEHMGEYFGATLYQKEVDYLIQHEWASSLEDVLFRRSKLGLFLSENQKAKLGEYLTQAS